MATEKEKKYEIYLVTCVVTGKSYVGKTVYSAKSRWWGHCSGARSGVNSLICRAIAKYGKENFTLRVLYQGSSEREIFSVEKAMIAQYRTFKPHGYNLSTGGEGPTGHVPSAATRQKLSAALKGRAGTCGMFGKKHSPESLKRMSETKKKMTVSAETRAKQASTRRGRPMPEGFSATMSRALSGKKRSPEAKAAIAAGRWGEGKSRSMAPRAVICTTNDTLYRSGSAAARYVGISQSAVASVLRGTRSHARGYQFVYADGEP